MFLQQPDFYVIFRFHSTSLVQNKANLRLQKSRFIWIFWGLSRNLNYTQNIAMMSRWYCKWYWCYKRSIYVCLSVCMHIYMYISIYRVFFMTIKLVSSLHWREDIYHRGCEEFQEIWGIVQKEGYSENVGIITLCPRRFQWNRNFVIWPLRKWQPCGLT